MSQLSNVKDTSSSINIESINFDFNFKKWYHQIIDIDDISSFIGKNKQDYIISLK